MSDNLRADAIRRQALLRQRIAQGHSDAREPIHTFEDGGRVYRANDGALSYSSPGYSTNNPNVVRRIMAGEPVADAMQAIDAPSTGGRVGAVARSGLQGLTFGAGDEVVAAGTSLLPGRSYDTELERERQRLEQGRSEFPVSSLAGEIGGAAATGIALGVGPVAAQRSMAGRVGAGVGVGAVEGGLYGFGAGEGGVANRAESARNAAVIGGAAGGVAPPIARALGGLARGFVVNPAQSFYNSLANSNLGGQTRAVRAIARALQDSGRSADDVTATLRQAADEGQEMFTVADALGIEGRRTLSGTTTQPGPARELADDFLVRRQDSQSGRVGQFVRDAFGDQDTAALERARLVQGRGDDAGMNYAAAGESARPVDVSGAVGEIDDLLRRDPILGETSLTQGALGRRLQTFRDRLANEGEQAIDFDTVRQIRTDLRDYFDRNPQARAQFGSVYDRLTDALRQSSPDFQQANDAYRSASRVIDAVDEGRIAARPGTRFADVQARFRGLSPDEQDAYRVGLGDEYLSRIESATDGVDAARPFRSDQRREIAQALADDPNLFTRRIERERDMTQTLTEALRGSPTAARLADQATVNAADVGVIQQAATNPVSAAWQLAGRFIGASQGDNAETRAAIARALLSRNARPVQQAAAQLSQDQARHRLAELLARRSAQTAGYAAFLN